MLAISSPRHGAILNRHDGIESACGLAVEVTGYADSDREVSLNGIPVRRRGDQFCARLTLTDRLTELTAQSADEQVTIAVLYDKQSFKRYRLSLDDNIRFLRDIAEQQPASIFENPYMALWKRLHDTYGTKINCNVYFQCDGFDLTMMPEHYKNQWQDNADWFRMTFHALQNDPSEPYRKAGYQQVARDFERVTEQIVRFAGETCLNTFTTIHWGEATREGCRALRDRGIKGLCGYFRLDPEGRPKVSYYADQNLTEYMTGRDYWKDLDEDLIFIRHDLVINAVPLQAVTGQLRETAANPHQRDVMELMIHEQYFYPDYAAYLPDYAQRCETAIRWMCEHGYQSVFFSNGFLGVPD